MMFLNSQNLSSAFSISLSFISKIHRANGIIIDLVFQLKVN